VVEHEHARVRRRLEQELAHAEARSTVDALVRPARHVERAIELPVG